MESQKIYGLLARFESPEDLMRATIKVRNYGFTKFDCHTPYPVHGLDEAMGLKRSILGYIVGAGAIGGASIGMLLQWYTSTVEYPVPISGKPFFSWQAYMIITFVLMVLGGALASLLGMFHLNRMPSFHHPLFNSKIFERSTDDCFFISIESKDSLFDGDNTIAFLKSVGGRDIEVVNE